MSKDLLLKMAKKILVVGCGNDEGKLDAMLVMKLKEEFGEDTVFITPSEAIQKGMNPEDFDDTTGFKMKILNPYADLGKITLRKQDAVYTPGFAGGRGKGDRAKNRSRFLNNFQKQHKRK